MNKLEAQVLIRASLNMFITMIH